MTLPTTPHALDPPSDRTALDGLRASDGTIKDYIDQLADLRVRLSIVEVETKRNGHEIAETKASIKQMQIAQDAARVELALIRQSTELTQRNVADIHTIFVAHDHQEAKDRRAIYRWIIVTLIAWLGSAVALVLKLSLGTG